MVQGFCTSQNTEFVIGDNSEFKRILFANADYRPLFCVKKCTQNQYSTGWNAYTFFCTQILVCSPFLTDTFPEWESDLMFNKGKRYDVTVISSFMEYLVLMEKKSGHLICSYLTAVRWNLIQSNVNIDFLQHPLIKASRAAFEGLHRLSSLLEDKRFPATAEFVKNLADYLLGWKTFEGMALALGAYFAFVTLLRRSEYIHLAPKQTDEDDEDEDGYHTIRAQDVLFEFLEPNALGVKKSVFVSPSLVHLHSKGDLVALDFIVPSSKTDQKGEGIPFHVSRMKVSPLVAFDLVDLAYDWSFCARPEGEHPFLSWNKGKKWPSYRKFNLAIKKVAGDMGFPTNKATTHCLRIGGATAMSLAGISDHMIMIYGRWKSLAFLLYARKCRATSDLVVSSILNPINFTSDDVIRSYGHNAKFRVK